MHTIINSIRVLKSEVNLGLSKLGSNQNILLWTCRRRSGFRSWDCLSTHLFAGPGAAHHRAPLFSGTGLQ